MKNRAVLALIFSSTFHVGASLASPNPPLSVSLAQQVTSDPPDLNQTPQNAQFGIPFINFQDIASDLARAAILQIYNPAEDENKITKAIFGNILGYLGLYREPNQTAAQIADIQQRIIEIEKKLDTLLGKTDQVLQKLAQLGYQHKVDALKSEYTAINTQWNWYNSLIYLKSRGNNVDADIASFAEDILRSNNMQEHVNRIHSILTEISPGSHSLLTAAGEYLSSPETLNDFKNQNGSYLGINKYQEQLIQSLVDQALLLQVRATTMILDAANIKTINNLKNQKFKSFSAPPTITGIPKGPVQLSEYATANDAIRAIAFNTLWQNVRKTISLVGYPLSHIPDRLQSRFGTASVLWDAENDRVVTTQSTWKMHNSGFLPSGATERDSHALPISFWQKLESEWKEDKKGLGFTQWLNKVRGFNFNLSIDNAIVTAGSFKATETLLFEDYLFYKPGYQSDKIVYEIPILTPNGIDYQTTTVRHNTDSFYHCPALNFYVKSALCFSGQEKKLFSYQYPDWPFTGFVVYRDQVFEGPLSALAGAVDNITWLGYAKSTPNRIQLNWGPSVFVASQTAGWEKTPDNKMIPGSPGVPSYPADSELIESIMPTVFNIED